MRQRSAAGAGVSAGAGAGAAAAASTTASRFHSATFAVACAVPPFFMLPFLPVPASSAADDGTHRTNSEFVRDERLRVFAHYNLQVGEVGALGWAQRHDPPAIHGLVPCGTRAHAPDTVAGIASVVHHEDMRWHRRYGSWAALLKPQPKQLAHVNKICPRDRVGVAAIDTLQPRNRWRCEGSGEAKEARPAYVQ